MNKFHEMSAEEQLEQAYTLNSERDLVTLALHAKDVVILSVIARRQCEEANIAICNSPLTPSSTLGYLYGISRNDYQILYALARNEKTPDWILEKFLQSNDMLLRSSAWYNRGLPHYFRTPENNPARN